MNFLQKYSPQPIIFESDFFVLRFYGLIIVIAIILCFILALHLAKKTKIKTDDLFDLVIWLMVGGIVGARLYDVIFIEWEYFRSNLLAIFKIWEGGLSIHGTIIGGIVSLFIWSKIHSKNFWKFAALIFTVLPLGQAIGRWGNYFNQELFGYPTNLPWGIFISPQNRPMRFFSSEYFHPTFLYESILNLILFFVLFFTYKKAIQSEFTSQKNNNIKKRITPTFIIPIYLLGYSIIRFTIEFVRIDETPTYFGLRLPQIASIIIFLGTVIYLLFRKRNASSS